MPRPKFIPTTAQRRMLDTLTKAERDHARKQAAIDEALNRVIAKAVEEDIPVSLIAETLGWTRGRVYRHLGREM